MSEEERRGMNKTREERGGERKGTREEEGKGTREGEGKGEEAELRT